jgi:hypothetical protein
MGCSNSEVVMEEPNMYKFRSLDMWSSLSQVYCLLLVQDNTTPRKSHVYAPRAIKFSSIRVPIIREAGKHKRLRHHDCRDYADKRGNVVTLTV